MVDDLGLDLMAAVNASALLGFQEDIVKMVTKTIYYDNLVRVITEIIIFLSPVADSLTISYREDVLSYLSY